METGVVDGGSKTRFIEAVQSGLNRVVEGVKRPDFARGFFDARDIHDLRFIKRARNLGFSVAEITRLLGLWRDFGRPSREVKKITAAHIADLEVRIAGMQGMMKALKHLASHCHGNDRPDCPILDGLGGVREAAPKGKSRAFSTSTGAETRLR
jgi:MerR family copper efflux transcriptional regulator